MATRRRYVTTAMVAVAFILTIGLLAYGFSLRLPFFWDDLLHFRWLERNNLARVWRSTQVFSYYRPLPFTLWKALRLLQGHYDPFTLHAVNLALHLLNALLVLVLVASRREDNLRVGIGAAVLFLLYPFSYQAVPWVGALTHLLVMALILGSVLLHLASRRGSEGKSVYAHALRAVSLGLALIAPFAHQTGVLVAPCLVLLLLTDEQPPSLEEVARETWPYWVCAAMGFAVWLFMPREPMPLEIMNLEGRWQTGVYFLQGLAYPVAPVATWLMGLAPRLNDLIAVALVGGLSVAAWSLFFWRVRCGRLVALALGWFALAAAPAWAMLKFSNVVDGPRLLYEASVGAALLWALPLSLHSARRHAPTLWATLSFLVVAAVALGSYLFIGGRVRLYEQMHLTTEQLAEARAGRLDQPLVCVNYPSWFAPTRSVFAVGHEGVVLVPEYTSVSDILWLRTGRDQEVTSVVLPDLLRSCGYHYACIGSGETADSIQAKLRCGQVVVAGYEGQDVALRDAGGLEGKGRLPARTHVASYADEIGLVFVDMERQGVSLRITLHWQCWKEMEQDTTGFVHLYDEAGQLATQADGHPLLGTARLTAWQAGDEWRDVRYLQLPEAMAPGRYAIKVGLYPVAGGERLRATDAAGGSVQDDAVPIGTLTIP